MKKHNKDNKTPQGVRPVVWLILLVLIAGMAMIVGIVCTKKTQVNSVSTASEQATASGVFSKTSSVTIASSALVDDNKSLDNQSSNGLIKLQLNPSFSKQLPSPEAAQKALAVNNEFTKSQQSIGK